MIFCKCEGKKLEFIMFTFSPFLIHLADINECLINNGGCEHQCINTLETFQCVCNPGYRPAHDNIKRCVGM